MGAKKKKVVRHRRGLLCTGDAKLAKFSPSTGKKFKHPMCVMPSGKVSTPKKAPTQASAMRKTPALDCRKGYELGQANPMTGKKYARPVCIHVSKGGKVKTKAPTKGKKSRAAAVKVTRMIAVSGRR